jgi:hypothetical protein
VIKLFITFKNPKQNKNSEPGYVFLGNYNVKTSPHMNFSHNIEPFDTKNDRFDGLNRRQRHFLSILSQTTD